MTYIAQTSGKNLGVRRLTDHILTN